MGNVYTIEFEQPETERGPRYGHVSVEAPAASAAMWKFMMEHPRADVREMRRTPGEPT